MLSPCARAVVTTLLWYRMGENDPGAGPGITATNTIDSSGLFPLPVSGPAVYLSDVASSAAVHVESSLSIQFTNSAYAVGNSAAATLTNNNFGIECWVKPASASGTQIIAYNGNTGLSGWGLIITNSSYAALLGGQVEFGSGVVIPGVWTHLALVCNNGTNTLYVNGISAGTTTAAPNVPSGAFGLAAPPQAPSSDFFTGEMDEVRIFTFAPGQFSAGDLLVNHNDVVYTLADDGSGDSLRSVIADSLNGDKITFATNGTITLTNGEIPVPANVNIVGPSPTNLAISGNAASRAFTIGNAAAQIQMSGLTISDCTATPTFSGNGGAIYNTGSLTLSNCIINGCSAMHGAAATSPGAVGGLGANGGAIYNSGTLSLIGCYMYQNLAGAGGSGAAATSTANGGAGGSGGIAGGIFNTGNLVVSNSTFYANSGGAGGSGGAAFGGNASTAGLSGNGGNVGGICNSGTATFTSCTVYNNAPGSGETNGFIGGIYNSGVMNLVAATIAENYGRGLAGGIYNTNTLSARNCLIAGNNGTSSPDCCGQFTSQGHNLIGNDGGSSGFVAGTDGDIVGTSNAPINPVIAPLANNGGLTPTVALRAGSPALDAGDTALLSVGITTDQRGLPREFGGHVDIGAYETIIGTSPELTGLGVVDSLEFRLAFTNTPHAAFTVLRSTNFLLPRSNWTVAGAALETSPGQFQYFDLSVSVSPREFYTVRSP